MLWQAILAACNWIALIAWVVAMLVTFGVTLRGRFEAEAFGTDIGPVVSILSIIVFFGLLNGVI